MANLRHGRVIGQVRALTCTYVPAENAQSAELDSHQRHTAAQPLQDQDQHGA
jgi:hypothetical protein